MSGARLSLDRPTACAMVDLCLRQTRELNAILEDIERRDSADFETAKKMVGRIIARRMSPPFILFLSNTRI